jgi:hypothetical protein
MLKVIPQKQLPLSRLSKDKPLFLSQVNQTGNRKGSTAA